MSAITSLLSYKQALGCFWKVAQRLFAISPCSRPDVMIGKKLTKEGRGYICSGLFSVVGSMAPFAGKGGKSRSPDRQAGCGCALREQASL
ncbi:hypothetical protein HMPREF0262_02187 [Clostridium sp. ATCC 29733]|nr:hypothetical protein HMPREF0262_02187 [Clostridium sp. ATCC 29733]